MIKQVMDGKKPMPSDPAKRAVYQVQIARLEEKQQQKNDRVEPAAAPAPAAVPTGPAASDTAKTEAELAAAAAASPDSAPGMAADGNGMNPTSSSSMSASNPPANEMAAAPPAKVKLSPADEAEARRREDRLYADLKIQGLIGLPPDQRYKKVMAMSSDEQVAFADSLRGGKGQDFVAGMDPKQKETLLAMNNPQGVVHDELMQAKLAASHLQRPPAGTGDDRFLVQSLQRLRGQGSGAAVPDHYEQDVIRPRALGKFEDLLMATAKSPAMLFYLDNWMSVGPNSMQALGIPAHPGPYGPYGPRRFPPPNPNAKRKQNSGLNENYGRELLELHTLSVNGGYSQRDVTEVAKVFTGWTIEKPYEGFGFKYDPRMHEPGPKFVLGTSHQAQGRRRGQGSVAPAGNQPADRALYFAEAGAAFCVGRSAGRAGRPDGKNLSEEEGRHPRSADHAVSVAGILGGRTPIARR